MNTLYEISFEKLDDGTIEIRQPCGLEEPSVIYLHPDQLKYIARQVAGLSETTAKQVEDLERKLSVITDRLETLVCEKWFRDEILDRCGNGAEMINKLDGLVDLAIEMDGGRLLPSEPKPEPEPKKEGKPKQTNSAKPAESAARPFELTPAQ